MRAGSPARSGDALRPKLCASVYPLALLLSIR